MDFTSQRRPGKSGLVLGAYSFSDSKLLTVRYHSTVVGLQSFKGSTI